MNSTSSRPAGETALLRTNLPLPNRREGKVRDVYRIPGADGSGGDRVLIVATDRISAFDVVMPTAVVGKGRVLTEVATRWFETLRGQIAVEDHVLSTDPADVPGLSDVDRATLAGRIMIGRACRVVPIECVVRGYLAGSGWLDYQETGAVCGVELPVGLARASRLPEPIFTPATKAEEGHDENIDFERAADAVGGALMEQLRSVSYEIYRLAARRAEAAGLILADTKFEFGIPLGAGGAPDENAAPILIDEVLTPDSSRYWPADGWRPGVEPDSFDKQFVRNHLLELVEAGRWDKTPPGPELPDHIVAETMERYRAAARRLFPTA